MDSIVRLMHFVLAHSAVCGVGILKGPTLKAYRLTY